MSKDSKHNIQAYAFNLTEPVIMNGKFNTVVEVKPQNNCGNY